MRTVSSRVLVCAMAIVVLVAGAWAEEDAQQIRELLQTEFGGHAAGDPDQILSCYDESVIGYWAMGRGPTAWSVAVTSFEQLREGYANNALEYKDYAESHPDAESGNEVQHIQVNGDHAIAASHHWNALPDSTARHTIINEHQSAWMLARIEGTWKITGFVGAVTASQQVDLWPPE